MVRTAKGVGDWRLTEIVLQPVFPTLNDHYVERSRSSRGDSAEVALAQSSRQRWQSKFASVGAACHRTRPNRLVNQRYTGEV